MGRLLHVSDIHFGAVDQHAVEAFTDYAHDAGADLVAVTGDITQSGRRREFAEAAAWLDRLPEPVFITPGNHDTPYFDLAARLIHPWKRWETVLGRQAKDHQVCRDDLMIRGVNTARGAQLRMNWSKGAICLEQTRRAADALAHAPSGALRVIACHHPLGEMVGGPMTGGVRRGDAAAEIFAAAGVDLVLSGHVHVPFALPIHAGDGRAYAVGAGTLSQRLRGMRPGFNVVNWTQTEIQVQALGWTGARFEVDRTWSLMRRDQGRIASN